MKKIITILTVSIAVLSCSNNENKSKAIAEDMCNCFNGIKDSLPKEAMAIFDKAAVAESAKTTYETEMKTLSPEAIQKTVSALMATSKPGSPISSCLAEIDKKYKTIGGKEKEMTQKMVDALKGNTKCNIMQTLMRMQLEKMK